MQDKELKPQAIPFSSTILDRSSALRKAGNLAEVLLWEKLKNRKLLGLKFTSQKIIEGVARN